MKIFELPQVGKVEVRKHHRAKRITLKLRQGEHPKVVIPKLMTYNMGFRFAQEKQDWIIKHLTKFKETSSPKFIFNESSVFKTRLKRINFKIDGDKTRVHQSKTELTLVFPLGTDIESEKQQQTIRDFIIEVLRSEAKLTLIPKVKELAEQYGFKYNNIYVKNLKTRWGSCSSINNINLNIHLMLLPEHLSDFVILHELCHTVQKNHGPKFHELLNTISGNEKLLNKELRNFRIGF